MRQFGNIFENSIKTGKKDGNRSKKCVYLQKVLAVWKKGCTFAPNSTRLHPIRTAGESSLGDMLYLSKNWRWKERTLPKPVFSAISKMECWVCSNNTIASFRRNELIYSWYDVPKQDRKRAVKRLTFTPNCRARSSRAHHSLIQVFFPVSVQMPLMNFERLVVIFCCQVVCSVHLILLSAVMWIYFIPLWILPNPCRISATSVSGRIGQRAYQGDCLHSTNQMLRQGNIAVFFTLTLCNT